MSTVWNPNLLAVAGLIVTACGTGFLGKAILSTTSMMQDPVIARRAKAQTRVDLAFGLPMLLAGFVILASAQFVALGPTPFITALLLLAAFALLVYGGIEGNIVEALVGPDEAKAAPSKLKLIAPPATMAPAVGPVEASADSLAAAQAKGA
ncbi:MAG: hypothetical protein KDJ37_00720 [Hyphomicrobiaceae bacterium]|nr:hypothetical protein [Hyphomicrobiaceae bacterium]